MADSTLRIWCSVGVLCIASFAMVTSEFAPIGLLSQISADLGQEPSAIALTVTLYAWIGAGSGLMSGWLIQRVPRKPLLVSLMPILAASNGLAALSSEYSTLLWARAFGALGHGVFWAIVAATAAHIAPVQRMGLATSIVLGGITIASVMGVPLVNLIGQYDGWRTAFACLALMCIACSVLIAVVLPRITIGLSSKGEGFSAVFRRSDLLITYVITGLTAAAHFGAYTFVEPFISQIPVVTPYMIAGLLFAFGASGFLGNLLSAAFVDRFLKPFILIALIAMGFALMTLGIYGPLLGIVPISGLLVIWGIAISALFTGLQTWVLRISGSLMVPATALHTAVLNSAIGLGVIVGGGAVEVVGLKGAMFAAAVMVVPAIILMIASAICARTKPVFL
ncbi:MFS transporter [Pararhizobium sp.]|uniref:MFS transporter n=1 Tax=Pararhizobium sp. TaxID=1977563 RepID=UPI003D0F178F